MPSYLRKFGLILKFQLRMSNICGKYQAASVRAIFSIPNFKFQLFKFIQLVKFIQFIISLISVLVKSEQKSRYKISCKKKKLSINNHKMKTIVCAFILFLGIGLNNAHTGMNLCFLFQSCLLVEMIMEYFKEEAMKKE